MEGRVLRRSVTLSEQLSVVDSSRLGDLLKKREEEEMRLSRYEGGDSVALESAMAWEKKEESDVSGGGGGRTLLDIILQEHEANGGIIADGNSSSAAAWKSLRDHFRLHSPGATCTAVSPGHPHPISEPELVDSSHLNPNPTFPSDSPHNIELAIPQPTTMAEVHSTSEGGSEELNASEDSDPGGTVESAAPVAVPEEDEDEGSGESPARVSLMALLEQTDRQWAGSGSGRETLSLVAAVAEEQDAEGEGVMMYMCCVCMVRHKGAAFIPCGHTFCRLCSRELWISRGTCPLCNGLISEILDIF
ncbi:E3 ubiquitin-protein ligase [Canna indica]|uniref:E3 ubiquitin-protein ligase n=1 Tax=Canna indica TaxID=4628 RepID=A0AAQ3QLW7_9LILI|nr:E3 ubiquitin-protein ligase [Canna indica]